MRGASAARQAVGLRNGLEKAEIGKFVPQERDSGIGHPLLQPPANADGAGVQQDALISPCCINRVLEAMEGSRKHCRRPQGRYSCSN